MRERCWEMMRLVSQVRRYLPLTRNDGQFTYQPDLFIYYIISLFFFYFLDGVDECPPLQESCYIRRFTRHNWPPIESSTSLAITHVTPKK